MSDDDISGTIEAKSDQLNAEDLLAGPRTIRVRGVKVLGAREDQPVLIYFDGDNDKPFKPCKSMRRVLAKVWGKYASQWVGKSMTLWNDPTVKWAGQEVGGIRISHIEGITEPVKMALTETRSKRKPFVLLPLGDVQPDKATMMAEALIERVNKSDDPTALSGDAKVIEQRDWLETKRPELAQRVTEAFSQRARNIKGSEKVEEVQQQPAEDPSPPADPPFDDDGYEGV